MLRHSQSFNSEIFIFLPRQKVSLTLLDILAKKARKSKESLVEEHDEKNSSHA